MISIKKSKKAPVDLEEKGKELTDYLCAAYLSKESEYKAGKLRFAFDRNVYGRDTVKSALKHEQHDKCFLCESRISHISYGDVEHFRPKGGWCQSQSESINYPGYYWLAYAWENLFLACQICNERFKKNLFPLQNEADRAMSHVDDVEREVPLFINPSVENPEDFISFRGTVPFAIDDNIKGQMTIRCAGLDRLELNEIRSEIYQPIKLLFLIANGIPETPYRDQAKEALESQLNQCRSDKHQYSAVFRAAVRDEFRY